MGRLEQVTFCDKLASVGRVEVEGALVGCRDELIVDEQLCSNDVLHICGK
jgi:hypothetical protein